MRHAPPTPLRPVARLAALLGLLVALAAPPSAARAAGTCLLPPVTAPVTDPFRMPACEWCPGNRGIEYGPSAGARVLAAAPGEVVFSGEVAGTRWLVVRHADGRRATYGRLAGVRVRAGQRVAVGEWIATTTDRFYFGLRDGDAPVDPTPLLGRVRYRPRLVPLDGGRGRPTGPGRLVCPAAGG